MPREFRTAAVIGTGMMGPGIALTLAMGGVKAAIISRSPGLIRPAATASTSAIGTDAAEVLPYFSMFR